MVTFQTVSEKEIQHLNEEVLKGKDTLDVLKWAYETYGDQLVYSCSFGAEGVVLIDLISKIKPDATIIFLDTNFHFKETYELIDKVKQKYPRLNIQMIQPPLTVEKQKEEYGDKLWERDPDRCCQLRKLEPLEKELSKYSAWISGLRREQSPTRRNTQYVNIDHRFNSIKVCPLIHWKEDEVWMYIKLHNLPYNELHDNNYPSIGCFHCTSQVAEGMDPRSGRWANTQKTECGLHLSLDSSNL
ncbi:phosphoadenylyl-sulfate reductase [Alkalihalobacillus sp. BA299]|uniref:phosphoadenylyl-sulfate reductase n=1 Tax=Alkalihalobacillus sp. BA299 TaxID=2815938 RepID=UPI001ADAEC31|nr:phosphoadenylyl-sulfate reductase [Alkalihalobacillus sp. BA299]